MNILKANQMNDAYVLAIALKSQMADVKVIDPASALYKSICSTLDKADNETLKILFKEKIAFISALALNRLSRRGVKI